MDKNFIAIAEVGELAADEMKAITVAGKRLLLVYAQQHYYVIDEMCSHEDYSLTLGCIKDKRIKCSLHGSYFDLDTGEALDEPADEPISSYAVAVVDNKIHVNPQQRRKS